MAGAQERLGRVGDAVAERRDRLAAAGPEVRLVVDEQRRAELGGEVEDVDSRRRGGAPSAPTVAVSGRAGTWAGRSAIELVGRRHDPSIARPAPQPDAAEPASRQPPAGLAQLVVDVVAQDRAVVVEAVDRRRELAHPAW